MVAYNQRMPLAFYVRRLVECLFAAFIVRSSACTINDIFDRKIDAQVGTRLKFTTSRYNEQSSDFSLVERTKYRPLPSGRISVEAAYLYLLVQYLTGTAFFYFTMDGIASVFTLVYERMKEINLTLVLLLGYK